jgi:hypothetical protein
MTDHHDFGDHDFDHRFDHDDYQQPDFHHDDQPTFDEPEHPGHLDEPEHSPWHEPEIHHEPTPTTEDVHVVDETGHHDTALYDDPAPADVFPPPVDVGALPEPVDGFPWTDAATLGAADFSAHDTTLPVDPHELAEYAGTEIPPGADPWTVLADSDDPATSTLARFFNDTNE